MKQQINIFWFRRDLRLKDNVGLLHATNSQFSVLPIFIFDPNVLNKLESRQDRRVQFIYEQVIKIKHQLEQFGSTLFIFHDTPENVFKQLLTKFRIQAVFANRDYEPYALKRDRKIDALLAEQNIKLHLFKDQVIFEGKEVLKQDGTPFKVFTPYKRTWLTHFHALKPTDEDKSLTEQRLLKIDPLPDIQMSDLGFQQMDLNFPSEEINLDIIAKYGEQRDFPAMNGTSRLGVHLRFGTVSIRKLAIIAKEHSDTWLNELIWREFYSSILQHFPHVTTNAFNKKYDNIPWRNDPSEFQKWCDGQTGFPIVDAGMRELLHTGYMHNRLRMITASFLTKHLLIDWRWGEAHFANKLLDFELASNNGGWQWAAGTGTDAQPYFRVFNPDSQTLKFDPDRNYIKKWVPEFDTLSYPRPMVDHKQARIRAIETYKKAVS